MFYIFSNFLRLLYIITCQVPSCLIRNIMLYIVPCHIASYLIDNIILLYIIICQIPSCLTYIFNIFNNLLRSSSRVVRPRDWPAYY
jgi:hypothetical protein